MKYNIRGDKLEVTDAINNYVESKLDRLNKYRNVRNILSHDSKEIKKNKILTKYDLKWIKKFNKSLKRKKDSISAYLRKARKYARRRKLKKVILVVLVLAAAAAAVFGLGII